MKPSSIIILWAFHCIAMRGLNSVATAALTFTSNADDEMWLYIDGQQVLYSNEWTVSKTANVPDGSKVIAAKINNLGGGGGLLGSLSDGRCTDTTWKCTDKLFNGWMNTSFDDSSWPAALASRGQGDPVWGTVTKVASNCKWIWFGSWYDVKAVYCRRRLDELTFLSNGDNEHRVYGDGAPLVYGSGWNVSFGTIVPYGTQVVSVWFYNHGGPGGLIGSFSDGRVTDASWKCTATYSDGWTTVNFNDNTWPAALATRGQNDPAWGTRPAIASSAKWITAGSYDTVINAYCRKRLMDLTFTSYGDNEQSVYADGKPLGQANWPDSLTVNIPRGTAVVAVKIVDKGIIGGLLGSFSDGRYTDGTWRCTRNVNNLNNEWTLPTYDDSSWPQANATIGQGDAWVTQPKVSLSAKWIWAGQYKTTGSQVLVYCRKNLARLFFTSNGDNKQWIYADGVLLSYNDNWLDSTTVEIPYGTKVVAVKVLDNGGAGGLLGSFSDDRVTDSSWKCTRNVAEGNTQWALPTYDDSSWPAAVANKIQNDPIWGGRPLVSLYAKWIWAGQYETNAANVWVYCRKSLK